MNLLVLHSSSEMYGSDRMLLNVIEVLIRSKNLVVHVLLPNDCSRSSQFELELREIGATYEYAEIPIIRRAYFNPIGAIRLLKRMIRTHFEITRFAPDYVWFSTSATLLNAPIVSLRFKARTFLHVQENWTGGFRFFLSLFAWKIGDLVVISNAVSNTLPRKIRKKSTIVANAVKDSCRTAPAGWKSAGGASKLFLFASRWTAVKGIGTLILAWGEIESRNSKLIIAGGPSNFGGNISVHEEVKRLDFSNSVQIVGEVLDLSRLIDKVDFVIIPSSWNEPFGIIAIEAMCRSTPVIASCGGGLGEIIDNGIDGFLFSNNNIVELTNLIDKASALDESYLQQMRKAARAKYEKHYSIDIFEKKICSLFDGF